MSIFDHTGERVSELKDRLAWAVKQRDIANYRADREKFENWTDTVIYLRKQLTEAKAAHASAILGNYVERVGI